MTWIILSRGLHEPVCRYYGCSTWDSKEIKFWTRSRLNWQGSAKRRIGFIDGIVALELLGYFW